jgi:hypothetical protein
MPKANRILFVTSHLPQAGMVMVAGAGEEYPIVLNIGYKSYF